MRASCSGMTRRSRKPREAMICRVLKALKRPPYIELASNATGAIWHWRLRAQNGEIMCASETYASKSNAKRAAERLASLTGWRIKE